MKKSRTPVTDHAVLRYLERVEGIDIEAVRRRIGKTVDLAGDHPAASAILSNGVRYHLRACVVVTITLATRPDLATGRQRKERGDE